MTSQESFNLPWPQDLRNGGKWEESGELCLEVRAGITYSSRRKNDAAKHGTSIPLSNLMAQSIVVVPNTQQDVHEVV